MRNFYFLDENNFIDVVLDYQCCYNIFNYNGIFKYLPNISKYLRRASHQLKENKQKYQKSQNKERVLY